MKELVSTLKEDYGRKFDKMSRECSRLENEKLQLDNTVKTQTLIVEDSKILKNDIKDINQQLKEAL